MDSKAPTGVKGRGRRLFRLALLLMCLPLLGYGASNLLLATPWVRARIEARVQEATGLQATVGSTSWSPWNGITIRRIALLQPEPLREALPEPLVEIVRVRVTPVWKAWLRGQPQIQAIHVSSPRIVLPLETLAHLAAAAAPPPAADPVPTPGDTAVATAPAAPRPAASELPPEAGSPAAAAPPPPAAPSGPTAWIHLDGASVAIVASGHAGPLLEIGGIDGAIPFGGSAAESQIVFSAIAPLGVPLADELQIDLAWRPPLLAVSPVEIEIGGATIRLAAKMARSGGFPFQIAAEVAPQPLGETPFPGGIGFGAERLAAQGRFTGLLAAPTTWSGDLVAEGTAPVLRLGADSTTFDSGRVVAVLRGGAFSCRDARLTSDPLSLLGNATLLADGRFAGILRLVAPPGLAQATARRFFPAATEPLALTPLASPQRVAFDVEAFGTFSRPFLRLGHGGPIIDLNQPPPP